MSNFEQIPTVERVNTLVDALHTISSDFPDHGLTMVGHTQHRSMTYAQLWDVAGRMASVLSQAGLGKGDPVIISVRNIRSYFPLFWGVLLAGGIPVPLAFPYGKSETSESAARFNKVREVLKDPLVLSDHMIADVTNLKLLDALVKAAEDVNYTPNGLAADDIALIQFSSGSTGNPKGIVLTHHQLLCNIYDIAERLRLNPGEDSSITWMPLHHDMGLIGFHLTPLVAGLNQWHLSSNQFIRNPFKWLRLISDEGISISGSPTFGLDWVLKSLEKKSLNPDDLSLACLRTLIVGAEPIHSGVLDQFATRFRPFGLRKTTFSPAYGLAEACLAVTMVDPEAESSQELLTSPGTDHAQRYVSTGKALKRCRIRLVDESGLEVETSQAGEIQIQGQNVSDGYWSDGELTPIKTGGWMSTGDIGILSDGELYIVGRKKDLIFLRGRNLVATDIEKLALNLPNADSFEILVCGVWSEVLSCDLLLVFVIGQMTEAMARYSLRLERRIKHFTGMAPHAFVAVKRSRVSFTTSGKPKRYLLREAYLKGAFDEDLRLFELLRDQAKEKEAANRVPPQTWQEKAIYEAWKQQLGAKAGDFGIDDDFFEIGGDSLDIVEIEQRLNSKFQFRVDIRLMMEKRNIRELANLLTSKVSTSRSNGSFSG